MRCDVSTYMREKTVTVNPRISAPLAPPPLVQWLSGISKYLRYVV